MFPGKEFVYHHYQDWVLAILVISTLSLVYSYYLKPLYFTRLANSLVNMSATSKLNNEKNSLTNRISRTLNFIFHINAGLFIFLFLKKIDFEFPVKHVAIQIILLIIALQLLIYLRLFIYHIIGQITNQMTPQQEYSSYWMMLNKTLGILFIPGVLCVLYLPITDKSILFNIYLGILILLYVAKLIRGVQISIHNKLSLFSIILYLCALEIMPILMLIKYLMST